MQSALLAYHVYLERYATPTVERPWAVAKTVLTRAIHDYYYLSPARWARHKLHRHAVSLDHTPSDAGTEAAPPTIPCDLTGARTADPAGGQAALFDLDDYFRALEEEHGVVARALAQQLLLPSGPVAARLVQRLRTAKPTSKRTARVTAHDLQTVLGVSSAAIARELRAVRSFTREWLARAAV